MKASARFSPCRHYRYALWRVWDQQRPGVLIIGLNPSTADETTDDPTIRRCIRFASGWGYGGLCMANLFACCATRPADLKADPEPVGPGNDEWLVRLAGEAGLVVAAWGNHGVFMNRSAAVQRLLPELHCLSINGSGEPAHPLYLRADLTPRRWRCSDRQPPGRFQWQAFGCGRLSASKTAKTKQPL